MFHHAHLKVVEDPTEDSPRLPTFTQTATLDVFVITCQSNLTVCLVFWQKSKDQKHHNGRSNNTCLGDTSNGFPKMKLKLCTGKVEFSSTCLMIGKHQPWTIYEKISFEVSLEHQAKTCRYFTQTSLSLPALQLVALAIHFDDFLNASLAKRSAVQLLFYAFLQINFPSIILSTQNDQENAWSQTLCGYFHKWWYEPPTHPFGTYFKIPTFWAKVPWTYETLAVPCTFACFTESASPKIQNLPSPWQYQDQQMLEFVPTFA